MRFVRRWWILLPLLAVAPGCFFLPAEFGKEAQERAHVESTRHAAPSPLSSLTAPASWAELLQLGWHQNGSVEAAYQEWVAALDRVRNAAAYPNTNLHLGLDYAVGRGGDPAGRTGISLGNDPMLNLSLPVKVSAAAEAALAEARAARERWRRARLELQEEVLRRYFAWAGLEHQRRLQEERVRWLQLREASLRAQYAAQGGSEQMELLRAQRERLEGEDLLARYGAQASAAQRELNALVGRPADAPLAAPESLMGRPWSLSEQELRERLAQASPPLGERRADLQARQAQLRLARLQFLPDLNPMLALSGMGFEAIGGALVLPLTWRKLAAALDEARALLAQSEAALAQEERDQQGQAGATWKLLQDAERQLRLWENGILPAARLEVSSAQAAYRSGREPLAKWAEAESARLALEQAQIELRVLREELLARLEALVGLEALPSAADPTQPQEDPHAPS